MSTGYKWHPITDFEEDPKSLTDGELEPLQRVWLRQKADLTEQGTLEEFEMQLRREWAIETGIIENVYALDRGVTRTLIAKGIDAAFIPAGSNNRDSAAVARIIQDHYDALDGMFDFVGGQRQLSTSYIKELHTVLLRNISTHEVIDQFGQTSERLLEKGRYKVHPNSPTRPDGTVHEFCPPEHVTSEMENLIAMHDLHQQQGVSPEVAAAWFHHRFTQIHPFADGNGRVARAVASLVFIKANWFPLIVKRDDRTRYIEALEEADDNNLRALVALFVEAQRNATIQAAEIAYEVRPATSVDEAIGAIRDRLLIQDRAHLKEWLPAKSTAQRLAKFTRSRFNQICQQLNDEIANARNGFTFVIGEGEGISGAGLLAIERAAHVASFDDVNSLVYLRLVTPSGETTLAVSFHALGRRFRGIIGVIAYLERAGVTATLIGDGVFQVNYEERAEQVQARFLSWLDGAIVEGLDAWRRSL